MAAPRKVDIENILIQFEREVVNMLNSCRKFQISNSSNPSDFSELNRIFPEGDMKIELHPLI